MNKNKFIFLSCSAALGLSANAQNSTEKPNILFILCDDMGYGDLGCYGQQLIATPHLDQMAAEGMRFTQAYSGSPVSAPSRATFWTGQHTGHTHIRSNKEYWSGTTMVDYGVNKDYSLVGQEPLDPEHIIIPEILKQNGYTTGLFGKWGAGYEGSASTPDKRGIDEFYGYICQFQAHAYYPNFLNSYSRSAGDTCVSRITLEENVQHGMTGTEYEKRTQYSGDLIHQKALEWLDKQQAGTPFAGFLTYTLPHAELYQPNDSILLAYKGLFCEENSGGDEGSRYHPTDIGHAQFAAMITRLDAYVGEILTKLKEKGLEENTIVIFTSDNGPHEEGGADPDFFNRDGLLRGIKQSTHEGGIRVPFIVRWPGKIQAGAVSDLQFAFYDLMPTFCDVAGITGYPDAFRNKAKTEAGETDYFDGISIYPTLMGQPDKQVKHDYLYWEFNTTQMLAVRKGDWKLVVQNGQSRLYDLANDLHEDKDVASRNPKVLNELKSIIRKEHVDNPTFPITMPR